MPKLIVNGGKKLSGTVTPVPNKNSILKILPACVLTDETLVLHNVPRTSDVAYMLQILEKLGGHYEWIGDNSLSICCAKIHSTQIDHELSTKMKASVMFSGPLLVRFGKVSMTNPQGCKLGSRPMDAFMENMKKMGADYSYEKGVYEITAPKLKATHVRQRFPSVTATENLILMAVLAEGTTSIDNAACEPHTQDLCNFLVSMGAKIQGIGSNKLVIEGVSSLSGTERSIISDHLDVAGLISAAVMTGGEITIKNAIVEHMSMHLQAFEKLGIVLDIDEESDRISVPLQEDLKIQKTIKGDYQEFTAGPWPLIPMDYIPILLVLAMHCDGSAIIHNPYYTTQFYFTQELAKMKGRTVMADPHRVITFGPTERKPANMMCSDIIQSSYAMLMAALAAPGTSTLNAITPLFRRFPNFVEQFNALGADLTLEE